jgi:hypothetical protein
MRRDEYDRLQRILSLEEYIPGWDKACTEMMYMPLRERKVIATLCRSQYTYARTSKTYLRLIQDISPYRYNMFERLCNSPLNCSILLLFSKLSPHSEEEVTNMKRESLNKEIECITKLPRRSELNWNCIFSDSIEPMHKNIPYNKKMAKTSHNILLEWRSKVSEMTLIPRISTKSIEKEAELAVRNERFNVGKVSQIDLELHYEEHGDHIEGPCELRQRFSVSNHEVRTYYAMGGTGYHLSKFVKKPFDLLVKLFDPCNSNFADQPQRLDIADNEFVYFYDLTSFTSNLHEHYEFVYRLALFCEGFRVNIFTTRSGIETVDLGYLLHEYNRMNNSPEISMKNIEKGLIIEQLVAGLLGVNGNMSSAKVLHTIVMMQTVQNMNKLNIAGDDGAISVLDEQAIIIALRALGIIKEEKAFLSCEGGCIHLKRPIEQIGRNLIQGVLFALPSFEYTYRTEDIDSRFTLLAITTLSERQNSTAGSVVNLLRSIRYIVFTNDEILLLRHLIEQVYKWVNLPYMGNVPQISGSTSSYGFVACIKGDYIGKDPVEYTINIHYNQLARVQRRERLPFEDSMRYEPTFECNQNAYLSYFEKLGYISSQKQSYSVYGDFAKSLLCEEYLAILPVVNTYTVLIPDFSMYYP